MLQAEEHGKTMRKTMHKVIFCKNLYFT